MGSEKAKVLLVEDHPIVRDGLLQLLGGEDDLTVCGQVENASQALKEMAEAEPDLVIVDISLRDSSGLELIKDIKARFRKVPVLVLSMHDESLYAERALAAGAKGYVMKEEATETLLAAIRRILAGDIWVSDDVAARMLHAFVGDRTAEPVAPVERLSDRELQVFELIGHGLGTRQVAAKLHLSIRTIETYRANIKQKLHLKSATELVRHAVHWVESEDVG